VQDGANSVSSAGQGAPLQPPSAGQPPERQHSGGLTGSKSMTAMDSAVVPEATKPNAATKLEASRQRSVSSFGTAMGGLFGKALSGIRSVVSSETEGGATRAKLGTENTFYYDENLKRWVDKSDPSSAEGSKAIAPPPVRPRDPASAGVSGGMDMGGPTASPGVLPLQPAAAVDTQTGMSTGLPPPRRRPGMALPSPSGGAPSAGNAMPRMMMPGGAVPMMPMMMPSPGGAPMTPMVPMMPGMPVAPGGGGDAARPSTQDPALSHVDSADEFSDIALG